MVQELRYNDGYVYRSTQEDTNGMTAWNISWIDQDDAAGWVTFNQSGSASDENCTYTTKGLHDESSNWNKRVYQTWSSLLT